MANTFNLGNGNWAQKTEKLLAYNAENDNYKPLPFDFDRGSTATVVNKNGLIETVGVDEPRIDFLNNTKGHLLLEPSRSNLITYSEDFSQGIWFKLNSTVTQSASTSPDGSQNAYNLHFNGTNNASLRHSITTTSTKIYTFSIWIKKISTNYTNNSEARIEGFGSGAVGFLLLGDALNSAAVGEFVRYSVTTTASTGGTSYFQFRSDEEATFEVWGAQVEEGSYATSYIPTSGSAVTRSAETTSQTVPDGVIGQTEGTLYFEGTLFESPSGSNMQLALSDDTLNNQIKFVVTSATTNIEFSVKNSGSTQVSINETISPNVNSKYAIAYKANDFVMYVNGVQSGSDTSGSVPTVTKISFDREDGNNPIHGEIKNLQLYNTRLSNSELQALTTI
jgi:hypothetical protein